MDTITQAVLGAAVGQAVAGPVLGRKALVWGALGGTLPDLDVIAGALTGPWGRLIWHRGPSHALWFGPVVGPMAGYVAWRWTRWRADRFNRTHPPAPAAREAGPLSLWMWLMMWAILTHPLLDVFTTYGTQLLAPFDDTRFAFNGVGIIDPIYTLILAAALVSRAFKPRLQRAAALVALALSTGYVLWGTWLNHKAELRAQDQLAAAGFPDQRIRAYPTMFQLYLRRVVAMPPEGAAPEAPFHVGYTSMWRPQPVEFEQVIPAIHPAVEALNGHPHGALFRWFAMDTLLPSIEPAGPGQVRVRLDDLRYGLTGEARHGMWGIEATADADTGALLTEPARFSRPRPKEIGKAIGEIFSRAFQ